MIRLKNKVKPLTRVLDYRLIILSLFFASIVTASSSKRGFEDNSKNIVPVTNENAIKEHIADRATVLANNKAHEDPNKGVKEEEDVKEKDVKGGVKEENVKGVKEENVKGVKEENVNGVKEENVNGVKESVNNDLNHTKKSKKLDKNVENKSETKIETKTKESTINSHNANSNRNDSNDKLDSNTTTQSLHTHILSNGSSIDEGKSNDNKHNFRGNDKTKYSELPEHDNFKANRHYAVIIISACTLVSIVIFQFFGNFIESKMKSQNDQYVTNVFNTCCRQVATISFINLTLWIILQSKIVLSIDHMFFDKVYDASGDSALNNNTTIEVAFEYTLYISVLLMMWYICYSLYFYLIVRNLTKWMRKTDELDVDFTIRKMDYIKNKWLSRLLYGSYISKGNFLALRYDFEENVNNAGIQSLDSAGVYFMDYLRASLLESSYKLLRMPNSCLVLVLITVLLIGTSFNKENEVKIICTLLSLCFAILLILYIHVKSIYNKLVPTNLSHYLSFKRRKESENIDPLADVETLQPEYKLRPLKPIQARFYTNFIYGTTNPNKHDQLFFFLSNGPILLFKIISTINFTILIILSLWLFLLREHRDIWLNDYISATWFIGVSTIVICALWPYILYSLLIATQGGMMINMNVLASVWESRRAENTKHGTELIDGIGLHAGLYSLTSGGDVQWRHLLAKFKTFSVVMREQLITSWNNLQENKSGSISIKQAAKYLYSQGLTNVPPRLVNDFIKSFSRTMPGKLTQEEFLMFALMVKQVIVSPLDTATLKPLFEEVYKIPWNNDNGINAISLQFICQQIGLKWSYGTRKHVIEFLSAGTKTQMSPEDFVAHMRDFEDYILQKAQDNSHYVIYGGNVQDAIK